MKKLSLFIALFTCLTIGGVYATWSYAGTNDIADNFAEAKVTIADVELAGANGTYKIESNLVLSVDQANDKHEAKLVFASNNNEAIYLKVTFTPAVNAPQNIKESGVLSELYFGTTVPMQYRRNAETGNFDKTATPVDIFTFSNPGNGVLDNTFTWKKFNAEGVDITDNATAFGAYFTYTLDETALKEMIKLNDNNGANPFVLDTKAEYDIFAGHTEYDPVGAPNVKEGLVGNILARVTDGTVNA